MLKAIKNHFRYLLKKDKHIFHYFKLNNFFILKPLHDFHIIQKFNFNLIMEIILNDLYHFCLLHNCIQFHINYYYFINHLVKQEQLKFY